MLWFVTFALFLRRDCKQPRSQGLSFSRPLSSLAPGGRGKEDERPWERGWTVSRVGWLHHVIVNDHGFKWFPYICRCLLEIVASTVCQAQSIECSEIEPCRIQSVSKTVNEKFPSSMELIIMKI